MTTCFCNRFSIIQTHYAWKMCSHYPGIKLEPALGTWEDKIEHLSSYAHIVHTTAKQVISRRRTNENVYKMAKKDNCTCKACKNTVFHCQICKCVGFLLPSSLWLLKLPNTDKATKLEQLMLIIYYSSHKIKDQTTKPKTLSWKLIEQRQSLNVATIAKWTKVNRRLKCSKHATKGMPA